MLVRKGDKVYACAAPTPRTRTPEEICEMIDRQKIRAEHKIAGSVADALEKAVKEADETILSSSAALFTYWEMRSGGFESRNWQNKNKQEKGLRET